MDAISRAMLIVLRKRKNSFSVILVTALALMSIVSVFVMTSFVKSSLTFVSEGFSECKQAMDTLYTVLNISKYAIVVIIVAIIVVILLFRLDVRKKEIAIYIALGKEKVEIFSQFIWEIMILTVVGLPVSAFAGFIIGNVFAKKMTMNALTLAISEMSLNVTDELMMKKDVLINAVQKLNIYFDVRIIVFSIVVIISGTIIALGIDEIKRGNKQARELLCKGE